MIELQCDRDDYKPYKFPLKFERLCHSYAYVIWLVEACGMLVHVSIVLSILRSEFECMPTLSMGIYLSRYVAWL
jgi:hypothetical protein